MNTTILLPSKGHHDLVIALEKVILKIGLFWILRRTGISDVLDKNLNLSLALKMGTQ
jgi:hypothetical protein